MKLLVSLALLTVTAVSFAFSSMRLRPRQNQPHPTQAALPATQAAPQAGSRLVGFAATAIVVAAPSTLVESYFYEGQYVRRGQVLAKLRLRSSSAIAYLNAPHDGVMSRARAQVGELLTPQAPLTTLTDQTRLLVRLHPAPNGLHTGDSVRVSIARTTGATVRGKITEWNAASAGPEVTLQLRRSVAGAAVGSALTVAPNSGSRLPLAKASKGGPAPKRRQLHYSLPVAQE